MESKVHAPESGPMLLLPLFVLTTYQHTGKADKDSTHHIILIRVC